MSSLERFILGEDERILVVAPEYTELLGALGQRGLDYFSFHSRHDFQLMASRNQIPENIGAAIFTAGLPELVKTEIRKLGLTVMEEVSTLYDLKSRLKEVRDFLEQQPPPSANVEEEPEEENSDGKWEVKLPQDGEVWTARRFIEENAHLCFNDRNDNRQQMQATKDLLAANGYTDLKSSQIRAARVNALKGIRQKNGSLAVTLDPTQIGKVTGEIRAALEGLLSATEDLMEATKAIPEALHSLNQLEHKLSLTAEENRKLKEEATRIGEAKAAMQKLKAALLRS